MIASLKSAYDGTVRNRARVISYFQFPDFLSLLVTPLSLLDFCIRTGLLFYGRLLMPKLYSSRLVCNVEIGAEIAYVCGVMRPILESI